MSDRRNRGFDKRGDRRKNESSTGRSILQAPIILDRRERLEPQQLTPNHESENTLSITPNKESKRDSFEMDTNKLNQSIPFMKRPNKFNTDTILKVLTDHPGHFVVGIIGKQGVGKSTILSHFTKDSEHAFSTQSNDQYLFHGHKTDGIDMYVTPERAILLDTEPVLCWTVLENALKSAAQGEIRNPDLWLEMENLYHIIFMLSVCNVVLFVTDGPEIDMDLLTLLQRAEMLKFCIPDFPLLVGQQDMHYYPDIAFVCNKCKSEQEFTYDKYHRLQLILGSFFKESQLKTKGLVNFGNVLPLFKYDEKETSNLFMLPNFDSDDVESFDILMLALRDQVIAAPRKLNKKGQVSEKDWFRNAVKTCELVRKSDYINEYLQVARKIRDS